MTSSFLVSIDDLSDPRFLAARRVVEDHPAMSGADWDDVNGLTRQVLDTDDARDEIHALSKQVGELVEAWRTVLEHGQKPAQYLLAACPDWVLDELSVAREAAA